MCHSVCVRFHCTHGQQRIDEQDRQVQCEFGAPAGSCSLKDSNDLVLWLMVSCEACRTLDSSLTEAALRPPALAMAGLSLTDTQIELEGTEERLDEVYRETDDSGDLGHPAVPISRTASNSQVDLLAESPNGDPPPYYDLSLEFDNVGRHTDYESNYQQEIWADTYFRQDVHGSASVAAKKYWSEVIEIHNFLFEEAIKIQKVHLYPKDDVFYQMQGWKDSYANKLQELFDREGRAQILQVCLAREFATSLYKTTHRRTQLLVELERIHRMSWTGSYNLDILRDRAIAQYEIFQDLDRAI